MRANDANNLELAGKILPVLIAAIAFVQNIQEHPAAAMITAGALAIALVGYRYLRSSARLWLGVGVLMAISVGCYVIPRITATKPEKPKAGTNESAGLPEVSIDDPENNRKVSSQELIRGHVKNGRLAVYLFQRHHAECEKGRIAVIPCVPVFKDGGWSQSMLFDGVCESGSIASTRYELHAIGVKPGSKLDRDLDDWQIMKPTDYKKVVESAPADAYAESNIVTVYRNTE